MERTISRAAGAGSPDDSVGITMQTRNHSSLPVGRSADQRQKAPHITPDAGTRRALVVDDEALIRWSLSQTLADHGFEVEQAASAAATLRVVADAGGRFDVVLLDLRLPDSEDLNLLMRLRQVMPETAIIMMTAFSTPETAQQALDLGAVRVVGKPFEMDDMAALVEQSAADRPATPGPGPRLY